ncbi:MAG: lyase, partial [Candidatus Methylomirabilales bacterium]
LDDQDRHVERLGEARAQGANAMVQFDPETERFTAFPSTQAGANVRQILGRPGEVWAPESGTDRLVVFRTR